ncbi:MAG: diaminopimelate epimerase [Phycisphaerae bacterium]
MARSAGDNRSIAFTKMHGLGNDYVYINCFEERLEGVDIPALARAMSDRHRGIGSDGIILIQPPDGDGETRPSNEGARAESLKRTWRAPAARMEMYNADGSRGEMCGNGIRCVAKYLLDHGLIEQRGADPVELCVQTDRGPLALWAWREEGVVTRVRVSMEAPHLRPAEIPVALSGDRCVAVDLPGLEGRYHMTSVSMGNPHAVVFVDSLDEFDLAERDPLFPNRVNLHVASVRSRGEASMRSWERGSGLTLACGTGACAVLVAGVLEDRLDRAAMIHLPGGDLEIEWPEAGGEEVAPVFMTGPAVEVFDGRWPVTRSEFRVTRNE